MIKLLFLEKRLVHNEMYEAIIIGEVENLKQFSLFGEMVLDLDRVT